MQKLNLVLIAAALNNTLIHAFNKTNFSFTRQKYGKKDNDNRKNKIKI